jgi:hypothetical protein
MKYVLIIVLLIMFVYFDCDGIILSMLIFFVYYDHHTPTYSGGDEEDDQKNAAKLQTLKEYESQASSEDRTTNAFKVDNYIDFTCRWVYIEDSKQYKHDWTYEITKKCPMWKIKPGLYGVLCVPSDVEVREIGYNVYMTVYYVVHNDSIWKTMPTNEELKDLADDVVNHRDDDSDESDTQTTSIADFGHRSDTPRLTLDEEYELEQKLTVQPTAQPVQPTAQPVQPIIQPIAQITVQPTAQPELIFMGRIYYDELAHTKWRQAIDPKDASYYYYHIETQLAVRDRPYKYFIYRHLDRVLYYNAIHHVWELTDPRLLGSFVNNYRNGETINDRTLAYGTQTLKIPHIRPHILLNPSEESVERYNSRILKLLKQIREPISVRRLGRNSQPVSKGPVKAYRIGKN